MLLVIDLILLQARPLTSRRNVLGSLALLGVLVGLAAVFIDLPTYFGQAYDDLDPVLFFGTIAGDSATSRLNFLILSLLGLVVGTLDVSRLHRALGRVLRPPVLGCRRHDVPDRRRGTADPLRRPRDDDPLPLHSGRVREARPSLAGGGAQVLRLRFGLLCAVLVRPEPDLRPDRHHAARRHLARHSTPWESTTRV